MNRLILSALLLYLAAACSAQDTADTISTIRVKKNKKRPEPQGIVTVGGMYYGRMQVEQFLQHDHLTVSNDNGKLKIISFSAGAATKGSYTEFNSTSSKIPPALKEAVRQEGSTVYFERITAIHEDGTTVTLNPVIIKLYDVATGNAAGAPVTDQSKIRATATVGGIRDGMLSADSLMKLDGILIMGNEPGIELISYDVQFNYKGTLFTMTSKGSLPGDLKKLLSQPQAGISQLTFENIKVKREAGDTVVLNPVIIKLRR